MDRLISCKFNMDTACVELKFFDGSMIAIDTIAVENEVADNISNMNIIIYDCDCFHSRSSSISFYSSNATIVSFGNFSFSQFRR